MSMSYAIRTEVNLQVILWSIASAIYKTVKGVQRLAGYLPALATVLAVLQVAGMTLGATSVIAAGLLVVVTFPAVVIGAFVFGVVAYVSMPR
jgi:hypothetical protein